MKSFSSDQVHYTWSARHEPIASIASGEVVSLVTRDGFDGQFDGSSDARDLDDRLYDVLDLHRVAPLTGPIFVEGASPGDALKISILKLEVLGRGTCVIWPAWAEWDFISKNVRNDFRSAAIYSADLDGMAAGDRLEITPRLSIALRPMVGMIGTAPSEGEFTTLPPREFGGNLDISELRAGATLYLPVFVDGALVSFGDGHAVQGDGEMCTTAIECPMRITAQIEVVGGLNLSHPRLETPQELMTISFGRSLDDAARIAIRSMIDFLVQEKGLSPEDSYMLCSLVGNLKINQVVDLPHVGMRMAIPKVLLEDSSPTPPGH